MADPVGDRVVAATNRIRPGDSSNSLSVRLTGFAWCTCPGTCSCPTGSTVGQTRTDITDSSRWDLPSGTIEDQIDPFLTVDSASGVGAVGWYDTAEDATGPDDLVVSIHGQVQPLGNATLVGQPIFYQSYSFPNDLAGVYSGAASFETGSAFALGYADGAVSGSAPNGEGGLYTSYVTQQ